MPLKVFVYSTPGDDESIWLIVAADREAADKLVLDEVDDEDTFNDLDCTEYDVTEPGSFVLRA